MITDDSLLPIFCIGDYVGGINVKNELIRDLVGEFCIIAAEDGQMFVKKIFNHQNDNMFMIGSINPLVNNQEPPYFICNIQSAAKISRHWRLGNLPSKF